MSGLQKMNVRNLSKISLFTKAIMKHRAACIYIKISRIIGNKTSTSTSFGFFQSTFKVPLKANLCFEDVPATVLCAVFRITNFS